MTMPLHRISALIYNGFNSSIDKYRGRHDIYGSMLAGASTGLIWKSTGESEAGTRFTWQSLGAKWMEEVDESDSLTAFTTFAHPWPALSCSSQLVCAPCSSRPLV